MASKKRITIKLESTGGTGCFYTTRKNPTNTPEKMTRMKFDRVLRRHVKFVEKKVK